MTDRISFLIDAELKRALKIRAAELGVTMTEILIQFIREFCKEENTGE